MPGVSFEQFSQLVAPLSVTVRFGSDAAESPEGRVALELATNLLARFYPKMSFDAVGEQAKQFSEKLTSLAHNINPDLELSAPQSPYIVIGTDLAEIPGFKAWIGSDGWNALFSTKSPQSIGVSRNPLGSAAAACFGAAAIFRHFFHNELGVTAPDEEFVLSLLDYSRVPSTLTEAIDYELGEIVLAGAGAIGNAAVWLLARTYCGGRIHVVDPEIVDDSNPQRYILTDAQSGGLPKVDLAARELSTSKLEPVPHTVPWSAFIGNQPNWKFPLAAVALDTLEDRIAVQASLPKWILNSWTQANDIGVSRHGFNSESACLACLYWPKKQRKNLDEMIKEAIHYSGELMDIRNMLYFERGLDDPWLERLSKDMGQSRELLEPFRGKTLHAFYREAICGGHIIAVESGTIEVPMAFQSAIAGIMLAGEIVKYGKQGRELNTKFVTTKIDLLRPLGTHFSEEYRKRTDVSCICSDEHYRARYNAKYM